MRTPNREAWLDVARGLAVVLMVVAHTNPVGGAGVVASYVTTPLFVMVLGVSRGFARARWPGASWAYVAAEWCRGLVLIGAGWALQPVNVTVWVVLGWLGAVVIVLAPVTGWLLGRPRLTVALAGLLAVAAPPLQHWGLIAGGWAEFVFAHPAYRMPSFLAFALVGVAFADPLRGLVGRRALGFALGLGGAALFVLSVGMLTPMGARPDSGQPGEVWSSLLMAAATLAACRGLHPIAPRAPGFAAEGSTPDRGGALGAKRWIPRRSWVEPSAVGVIGAVRAVGEMAFTAYVLHLVALRVGAGLTASGKDDGWGVMVGTIALLLVVCWGWRRLGWTGPLEAAMRLVTRPWRLIKA